MKKFYLFIMAMVVYSINYGQPLTGNKNIPGDYATITSAIADLNAQGVGVGGVTFNVAAGYTETFISATAGYITTNTGTAVNQIIFQKYGSGVNPKITAPIGVSQMDAIICLVGVSYVTFDGIDLAESSGNTNYMTQMEWGYALLKTSGTQGCQNNTIKNCTITLITQNNYVYNPLGYYYSCGIYVSNHTITNGTQLAVTAISGINSGNKIYGNTIQNCNAGIYFYGYSDISPYTYYDQNNDIGSVTGNTITNSGSQVGFTAYGIFADFQNGLKIANSNINIAGGVNGNVNGIYTADGTSSDIDIFSNTVTLSSPWSNSIMYGINNAIGKTPLNNTVNIYNNTVTGCTQPACITSFYGIWNDATAATVNFYGNTVSNNLIGGSHYTYLMYTTGGTTLNVYNNIVSGNQRTGAGMQTFIAWILCLGVDGTGITSIHDNQIFNNSAPAQATQGGDIWGIYAGIFYSATSLVIYNNSIHDQSITSTAPSSGHTIDGIYAMPSSSNPAQNSIYNNSIYNQTITLTTIGYNNSSISGIQCYYFNNVYSNNVYNFSATITNANCVLNGIEDVYGMNCYSNNVYNITETASGYLGYGSGIGLSLTSTGTENVYNNQVYGVSVGGASGYYRGIDVDNGTNLYVYNNYISDLKAPASTSNLALTGIYVNTVAYTGLYNNTVFLNATSTSTSSFGTAAVSSPNTSSYTLDMRNNILVNTSVAPGSSTYTTMAWLRSSTTYSINSNNNNLYAGTPSSHNLIYLDGLGHSLETLADYKTFIYPADQVSVTELPPFINNTTTPYNLHINTTLPTQVESGGTIISSPISITTDWDGDARYPNTGYPNNVLSPASAPDIGADEFGGIHLETTPPTISYTILANQCVAGSQVLTATITDASGVPTSGIGLPVMYYKVNAGAWQSQQSVPIGNSQYTFTINPVAVGGDIVSYYVCAQDLAAIPNTGVNPSAGAGSLAANPPAAGTPPTTPNSYIVRANYIAGTATADQTICYNTTPNPLTSTDAMGGSSPYTYQWQVNSSGWQNINGATTRSYTPGALSTTTQYRLAFTDVGTPSCGTVYSNAVTITVTPNNTITLTSAAGTGNQTVCINTPITNITYATTGATGATFSGLPAGVIGGWATNIVTINGTPTAVGTFNYMVTLTGGCGIITASGTITVTPNNTITLTSGIGTNSQTVCINTPVTNITYATTGATGAAFSGLPAGLNGGWAANVATISGTPTASGTFNYTVTLTGGCGTVTAGGTITVNPNNTITLTSAAGTNNQTVCINTPVTNTTYATTGATGAAFSGLPAGVNGGWAANLVTISGTPTVSGTFNYTVTLTGGCGMVTAGGTITVTPNNTITLTSAAGTNNQNVCINTSTTNITYTTTGAIGATFSGLPGGVNGAWAANIVTISGTPIASGTFNYMVTLTGGCGTVTATGTITVTPNNTITLTSGIGTNSQTVCINTPVTNITYTTTGATGAAFSGLPAGVNGAWAANVVTITGTPTVSGTFNYTISLTGGCGTVTASGTITVRSNFVAGTASANQTICYNTVPNQLTSTNATGGSSPYNYQWQVNSSGWQNIIGATTLNYSPSTLTTTTQYRLAFTDGGTPSCGTVYSNSVIITVRPNFVAGTASSDQTICPNTAPNALTSTNATGGSSPYSYQWQVYSSGWQNINGATTLSYSPGILTSTTQYRVAFTDNGTPSCGTVYSNTVTITVGGLSGTKTIPGDYPTIATAIIAINNSTCIGTGGVTFNVAAGYIETFASPTAGRITTSLGSVSTPIVFQKSGTGSNPRITAGSGTDAMDAIITFSGVQYITFDGIDLYENAANTNTTTQMEWGYALLKASGTRGSQNITIKNCTISLNKTNTATYGIYCNNHTPSSTTQLTVTTVGGQNSNNKFYGNTITNTYGGIYLNGFADPSSPYIYYDQNNDIGSVTGNTFTNFAGGSSSSYQVYAAYQNGVIIANSNINGGAGTTGSIYGIYGGTATNANVNIYGNTIAITSAATTNSIYAIYNAGLGTTGTTNTLNIYSNAIQNCTGPNSTSSIFYGIYNNAAAFTINLYGNTVNGNVFGGSYNMFLFFSTSATGGTLNAYNNIVSNNQRTGSGTQYSSSNFYCLYLIGSATMSAHDNQVFGNSATGLTTVGAYFYSLYLPTSSLSLTLYNNTVHDQTITSAYTSSHYIYGIYAGTGSGALNIYNNTVYNLIMNNSSTGYGSGYGIYAYGYPLNIYKNKIYNINSPGTSGSYYGLYLGSGSTINAYNNYISDIRVPASTSAGALYGVYIGGGTTVNLFYNTIYLNATSTSTTTFTTSGVYASTTPTLVLRNNIIINSSTAPGSTTYSAAAFRRSSTTISTYAVTSNNNDFYAGTPSPTKLIYSDGTNNIQTLATYNGLVNPRDALSVTEMPPFVNVTSTPYDLHIKTTIATLCESGGSNVAGITDDWDGDVRQGNAGYTGSGTAPDIGADEFNGLSLPKIIYTPLGPTPLTTSRMLTATITAANGVPVSGIGLPVLYWKVNTGSWISQQGISIGSNQYTFTFGGGTNAGDVVYYYVVAQDASSTPTVGSNPLTGAAGFTANPPAAATPPTTPNSYTILSSICGTFNVGVGQTYTTLTAAVNDLNSKWMSCPVTFLLTDASYSSSETFPIVLGNVAGSSPTNTLTIKPATGVTPTISGTSTSGIFLLNGSQYVTIDGSNNGGMDKSLNWVNTNSSANTYTIGFSNSGGTTPAKNNTIRNCIISSSSQLTNNTSGIFFNSIGGGYDNTIITNNTIFSARTGILYTGATTSAATNGQITNNIIGSPVDATSITYYGIQVQYADNTLISGNEIMGTLSGNLNYNQAGIYIGTGSTNTKIRKNKIHDWYYTGTDGWANYGIYYGSNASTSTEISNNLIYMIKGDGDASYYYSPCGIDIAAGGNCQIWSNSIYMTGSVLSTLYTGAFSACINIYPGISLLDIRDNILKNSMQSLSGTPADYTYSIYSASASTAFSMINYNDYWVDGINPNIGYLGNAKDATLAAWKIATGQDINSINIDPVFTSATNLLPTATLMNNAGIYNPLVPSDYAGTIRSNPPDIGAYEFASDPLVSSSNATLITSSGATLNGTINANNFAVNSFFDWGLNNAYGNSVSGTPATVTGTGVTSINTTISGLLPLTTYHFRARGVATTNLIVYGQDITFTTPQMAPIILTESHVNLLCSGYSTGSIDLTIAGGVGPYTCLWSNGSTAKDISGLIAGTYGVTVTDASLSTATLLVTISQPTAIVHTESHVNVVCSGQATGSIDLTVAGGIEPYNYLWSNGATTQNISGLIAGTYNVIITDANGCTDASLTVNIINVNPLPVPTITGPASVCIHSNGNEYTTEAGMTVYSWVVSAGGTITSGGGPESNTVIVTWNTAGAQTVSVEYTDANGCTPSNPNVYPVTVNALSIPLITCPGNQTVNCQDDHTPSETGTASATDNCPLVANIVITYNDASTYNADPANVLHYNYVITRTWKATDIDGNFSTCDQIITIQDVTAPVITCPANITVNCQDDHTPAATGPATATDNCAQEANIVVTYSDASTYNTDPASVLHYNYVITRTWKATDVADNYSTCDQIITVQDVTDPVITCPANITVNCQDDHTPAGTGAATATDYCAPAANIAITFIDASTYNTDPASVLHYNYVIARTWKAMDVAGNFSTCVQTITVQDVAAPVITCPGNVTVNCQDDHTPAGTGTATVTDNCAPAANIVITYLDASTYIADPTSVFHYNYVITRTWKATDIAGNFSTCFQTITVQDVTAPVITCPGNVTVNCESDHTPAGTGLATATDNCALAANIAITFIDASTYNTDPASLLHYNYLITRTWKATDVAGNYSTCDQIITVQDVTVPMITCPANQTVNCQDDHTPAQTGITTATDNCTPIANITISYNDESTYNADPASLLHYNYVITRIWTATDIAGNFSTCNQTITVQDVTPPVIACSGNITVNCQDDHTPAGTGTATATDNCAPAANIAITYNDTSTYNADPANVLHYNYVITRTWKATDIAGNFSTCNQTIIVQDVIAPVIACAVDATVNCQDNHTPAATGTATAIDNCAPAANIAITYNDASTCNADPANVLHYNYVITRTWKATDIAGNFSTCNQTITVQDVTTPEITCPGNATVNCQDNHTPATTGTATATDNCTPAANIAITYTDASTYNANPASVLHYNYVITRTWKATDVAGNFSTCNQSITVHDVTAPVITCPGNITSGQCNNVVSFNITATDNSTGPVVVVSSPASGSTFPVGVTTVNSSATDVSGNQSTCSFMVTILSSPLATAGCNSGICQGSTLSFIASGGTSYSWTGPNGYTSTDQNPSRTNATPAMSGTYSVIVTNNSGCTSSATVNAVVNPLPGAPSAVTGTASVLTGGTYIYSATITNVTTYIWTYSGTGTTISGNTNPVTITFSCNATNGNLMVKGHNSCGDGPAASVAVTSSPGSTINIYSAKLTTGTGQHPTSVKSAIMPVNAQGSNLGFKVFRSNLIGMTAKRKNFNNIWSGSCAGVTGNCSYNPASNVTASVTVTGPVLATYGGGPAYKYVMTVPAGKRYLVIAEDEAYQSNCNPDPNSSNPCYVYPGKRTLNRNNHPAYCDEDDDGDDDGDDDSQFQGCNSKDMFLQIIQDANGKIRPSNTDAIPGSLLLIISPNYVEFTDTIELLPIIYESVDGLWGVSTTADPPDGFYSVPATALQTEVNTSYINALQFTLVDTGSVWTYTRLTSQLRHNARDIIHQVEPDMRDHQKTLEYLLQNFPNPFSFSTTIPYILPVACKVTLSVYDIFGHEIFIIADKIQQKGRYKETWQVGENTGCDLPSGIYLAHLQATSIVDDKTVINSKSMVYIK